MKTKIKRALSATLKQMNKAWRKTEALVYTSLFWMLAFIGTLLTFWVFEFDLSYSGQMRFSAVNASAIVMLIMLYAAIETFFIELKKIPS